MSKPMFVIILFKASSSFQIITPHDTEMTTSSNFCELEIALESDIGTGISMSKHYNFTNFVIYAIVQVTHKPKCDYSTSFNHYHLCK